MVNLIFLDIDGVLNSARWMNERPTAIRMRGYRKAWERDAEEGMDPAAVGRLSGLVEATGAKIVISSSWRKMHSLPELDRMLRYRGLKGQHVLGATPDLKHTTPGLVQRGEEIDAWLQWALHGNWVRRFVVFDDDSDMDPVKDRLVQTDWSVGLTESNVMTALELLA